VPRKVLYVEDNPANVHLVTRLLDQRPEVEVVSAGTGEEGLRLAQAEELALILLDLRLPDMSGEQVLQRLKDSPLTAAIPVVVISGDSGEKLVNQLLGLGASAFLGKPFDMRGLLAVVDRFCT
jgi:two-component system CheB/CheR fusion protein